MINRTYPNIEEFLGTKWLENHPDHPFNEWRRNPEHKKMILLSLLEDCLNKVAPILHTKKLQRKLRNPGSFTDTYNELGVGCSLIDEGFHVDFEKTLYNDKGTMRTPDVFIDDENVIVEVKTLSISEEVERGFESGKPFYNDEARRIGRVVLEDYGKYEGQGFTNPLIVFVCSDFIDPPHFDILDFNKFLIFQVDQYVVKRNGTRQHTLDVDRKGLYYERDLDGRYLYGQLSGVGTWSHNGIFFIENPNVDPTYLIPEGELRDFLEKHVWPYNSVVTIIVTGLGILLEFLQMISSKIM